MYKTSGVLAAAYKSKSLASTLTHAVEYGADGWAVSVKCGRVKLDSLAAEHESDAEETPPTCSRCAK